MTSSVGTSGLGAPATGISAHDYEIDRIVGEDARGKWKQIARRQKDKLAVIEQTGATGFDLVRTPNDTYEVMDPEARKLSERSRSFISKMDAEFIRKHPLPLISKGAALDAPRKTQRSLPR